jgi:very-short-patch-repair endonuclease
MTMRARHLRRRQTEAERALWALLRGHRLARLKFRRQEPVGRFVVDFLCREAALVVEVDGPIHDRLAEYDAERQACLTHAGTVLRFSNDEVVHQPWLVQRRIMDVLRSRERHPSPAPRERGRGHEC